MIPQPPSFQTENKADFMIELRKKADEYFEQNNISKYANAGMVVKTIFMLTLYIAPYILMMAGVVSSTPLILLCWILMGFGMPVWV
jgi:linoleoyl-CoA desaturase